jgi:hypothetical protein
MSHAANTTPSVANTETTPQANPAVNESPLNSGLMPKAYPQLPDAQP